MALDGKTAIVTGGAGGIGKAIARRFLEEKASVVIADIDEVGGTAAEKELAAFGDVTFFPADVSEPLDVHNMVAEALDTHGAVDILINNAGILFASDVLALKLNDLERVLAVNVKGTFLCSQAAARAMVDRIEAGGPTGTIINISSVNDRIVSPDHLAYSVSKGGIAQMTASMAVALARYSIRVNAIGPGSIHTAMLGDVDNEARKRVLARTPLGRIGEPSEIAGVAAFLASDDASYITGQTIYVDGGRLALNYTVPVS